MARATSGIGSLGLRGAVGNVVFQQLDGETIVRARVVPHDPQTPAQLASRARMTRASQVAHSLSAEEWAAWRGRFGSRAYSTFCALATKWLAVHGGEEPPRTPPVGTFLGDAPVVVRVASGLPTEVRVRASQPNSAGVMTEVLFQPLATALRQPRPRDWRTLGYLAFAPGSLEVTLPLPPGVSGPVAVAYRFVKSATGEMTEWVGLE